MRLNFTNFLGTITNKIPIANGIISLVEYKSPVSEKWHYHENNHLSLILEGGNLESRKNESIQVSTGSILIYRAGELHKNTSTRFPSKNLNIELTNDFFKINNITFDKSNFSNKNTFSSYLKMIKLYHELKLNDIYTSNSIDCILYDLFAKEKPSKKPTWIKDLIELLEDRWNEFIPLQKLGVILNVHPVTISKYSKKYLNQTVGEYMRIVKLKRAFNFLLNSKKSITEISYACGFSDQSHMIKVFKAYVGYTPKEIRMI